MAVGIGYDIHALKKGRRLILGGVTLASDRGLAGHSDADALWHAIVDALLGAAGLGDIGEHFPDTDKRWKGVSSRIFAEETARLLKKDRWTIENVDAVILAEAPKISPYKMTLRRNIAAVLGIAPARVNVKAKTNEGFGEVGTKKAIAVYAVASLIKK